MSALRTLAALAVVAVGPTNAPSTPAPLAPAPPGARVAVLPVALNNLSTMPDDPPARIDALGAALRARLAGECGYDVMTVDSADAARGRAGPTYYYDHPDAAVQLARAAGAEWALIPRLNRASPWVTDLQLHVVRVEQGTIVSNRVVELKGFGMSDALTERLTDRGAAWMADQVDQAIQWATAPGAPVARHCPA
ncbi:MAG TPA: DUF2380 domain-containing protein [Gemmatimonadaceae bacterium]|nr:DUF2380 domain-containing protein [Gemmatimonadaceae bacterium]